MSIWLLSLLVVIAAVVTMLSGIGLILHLTSLAHTFAGKADIVPARVTPRARRWMVLTALTMFASGTLGTLVIVVLASTMTVP